MIIPGVETVHERSVWQDPRYPVFGPVDDPLDNDTVVIHYTGADDLIDGDPGEFAHQLPQYLRNMQYSYVTNRGYSVGYSFAVDWLGGVWQLRGWEFQSAANRGHNGHTVPVLMLVDGADEATPEAAASVRSLVVEAGARSGRKRGVVGHGELSGAATACPGAGLLRQIHSNVFEPKESGVVIPLSKPVRVYDSRKDDNLVPGKPVTVYVGWVGVPAHATGVFVTLTAVPGKNPGFLRAYGSVRPDTSDVNFQAHTNVANTTLVALSNGSFKVESNTWTDVVVDIKGYTV